jgi:hypothetical protein
MVDTALQRVGSSGQRFLASTHIASRISYKTFSPPRMSKTHPQARAGMDVPSLNCTVLTIFKSVDKCRVDFTPLYVIGPPATSATLSSENAKSEIEQICFCPSQCSGFIIDLS